MPRSEVRRKKVFPPAGSILTAPPIPAEGKYAKAVVAYSRALEVSPDNAILLSNRAFAHLRLENYGSAIEDASNAIQSDPEYIKAYYRRGAAQYALGHLAEALKDFKTVCRMHPQDRDGRMKLKECENALRRKRFEEAIAAPEEEIVKVSSTVDTSEMVVDSAYDGARLAEDGKITKPFIEDMIARFKEQKTIASKYAFEILMQAKDALEPLPSVVDLAVAEGAHFTVCGDVHGQFFDLCNIFDLNGAPSAENPYLFNGDFVDRGSFSVEVILTLLAYKVMDPTCINLTRGNHETAAMNKMYGFDGEVRAKYSRSSRTCSRRSSSICLSARCSGRRCSSRTAGCSRATASRWTSCGRLTASASPPRAGRCARCCGAIPGRCRGGTEQARRRRRVRRRRHETIFERERLRAGGPVARGEGRGVRGGPRRQTDHGVQRAQLLRPDGEQRRVHSVRERHDAALYAV